jgi:hypothetical protein
MGIVRQPLVFDFQEIVDGYAGSFVGRQWLEQ